MEVNEELKNKVKKFNTFFLVFIFAQFFLMISSFDVASRFKFLSILFDILGVFIILGIFLLGLSLFKLRKINRQFYLSLITFCRYIAVVTVKDICRTSTDDFYLIWGNALDWTGRGLLCVLYIYFFIALHNFFLELGFVKDNKGHLALILAFAVLFFLERLLVFLLFFDGIKFNTLANRICTYGKMVLTIVIYIYALATSIVIKVRYHNKIKEVCSNEVLE